ncbi:MAG: SAM-dependent chlorinase/fluorinase [Elusimicrobia bacterium]|nr:SAM-dependent chlorinase/fluorinase [Elusimicrobiota bacterium]
MITALLTDFGHEDPYVGIMKGVLLSRAPEARIVDLSHGVAPQDVRSAALQLWAAVPYFPEGTLFLCVVDPGVGSKRAVLWARGRRHQYLAADNGLLTLAARRDSFREVRAVTNRSLWLPCVSRTFHGRDLFAPTAGALLAGLPPSELGPRRRGFRRLRWPKARRRSQKIRGEIVAVDRFGNAVTNIPSKGLKLGTVFKAGGAEAKLMPCYSAARPGAALAVAGSYGFVELSVREGSFAARTGVRAGEAVHAG